jgi:inward rectifier potassium channel
MAQRTSHNTPNRKPAFDPGLTQQFTGTLRRSINPDGTFNVYRRGGSWRDLHPYLMMLNVSWRGFFAIVFSAYLIVNTCFAIGYFLLGPGQLNGADAATETRRFLNDFFFSAHTLTTVGYGNISPGTIPANALTAFEALTGLMGIALATGLLFGRFSRPSARIRFSDRILQAPYQDRTSLQVRIVNLRPNVLMDLEATMILMTVEGPPGAMKRRYQELNLERGGINFLALTWTIVHPIEEGSPIFGMTQEDIFRLQAEFVILVKGFDDTFSQTVHARYSYRYDELVWQARFEPAFEIDPAGDMVLNVDRVGRHTPLP